MLASRSITVRKIPLDVHTALRLRAAQHQRSTEAEVRAILATAVTPAGPQSTIEEFFETLPEHITPKKPLTIAELDAITAAGWAGQLT